MIMSIGNLAFSSVYKKKKKFDRLYTILQKMVGQSCRDRLHKWVWLKPEMYKRGEYNENYVI
jgi:hypothetical protein